MCYLQTDWMNVISYSGNASGIKWLVGYRVKANCPLVGPGLVGGVPSMRVFLRDPCLYIFEFRRKPQKTPNGYVDKRKGGLNLAPPVYQFRSQNHAATGGAKDRQYWHPCLTRDSNPLPWLNVGLWKVFGVRIPVCLWRDSGRINVSDSLEIWHKYLCVMRN